MNTPGQPEGDNLFLTRALEATIRIGLVLFLLYWCFQIGRPFLETIVWGIIIAVAVHPFYLRLKSALGGRGRLTAASRFSESSRTSTSRSFPCRTSRSRPRGE